MASTAAAAAVDQTTRFSQRWARVQRDNARWKALQSKEAFAQKFGTADTIIVEYTPFDDHRHWDRWNVHVSYKLLGIFPLSTVTVGTNLCRQEVEQLRVPFAKLQCRPGDPVPTRYY